MQLPHSLQKSAMLMIWYGWVTANDRVPSTINSPPCTASTGTSGAHRLRVVHLVGPVGANRDAQAAHRVTRQASIRLRHRLIGRERLEHLFESVAPIHGNLGFPNRQCASRTSGEQVCPGELVGRLGLGLQHQILSRGNRPRDATAIGDGADDRGRSPREVPAGEDVRDARFARLWVDLQRAVLPHLRLEVAEEVEDGFLADAHDDGVTRDGRIRTLDGHGARTARTVDLTELHVGAYELGNLAAALHDLDRSTQDLHGHPFVQCRLDLVRVRGHLVDGSAIDDGDGCLPPASRIAVRAASIAELPPPMTSTEGPIFGALP